MREPAPHTYDDEGFRRFLRGMPGGLPRAGYEEPPQPMRPGSLPRVELPPNPYEQDSNVPAPDRTTQRQAMITAPEVGAFAARQAAGKPSAAPAAPTQDDEDPNSTWRTLDAIFSGLGGQPYDNRYWTGLDERRASQAEKAKTEAKAAEQEQIALQDADPGSDRSIRARAAVTASLRSMGLQDEEIASLSASDVRELSKGGNIVTSLAEMRRRTQAEKDAAAKATAATAAGNAEFDRRTAVDQANRTALAERRAELRPKKSAGAGGGGAGVGDVEAEIRGYYGEQAVPAEVELQISTARGLPPKEQRKALSAIARSIAQGKTQDDVAAAKAAADQLKTDQQQSAGYGQELRLRGLDRGRAALANVQRVLADAGADTPGYGQTGMAPNWMLSDKGKEVRRAVKELMDTKLRMATGAAAPPSEQQTFAEILGVGALSTDKDLKSALEQAGFILDQQAGYVGEMYPRARQAGGGAGAPSAGKGGQLRLQDGSTAADTPGNRRKLQAAGVAFEAM